MSAIFKLYSVSGYYWPGWAWVPVQPTSHYQNPLQQPLVEPINAGRALSVHLRRADLALDCWACRWGPLGAYVLPSNRGHEADQVHTIPQWADWAALSQGRLLEVLQRG